MCVRLMATKAATCRRPLPRRRGSVVSVPKRGVCGTRTLGQARGPRRVAVRGISRRRLWLGRLAGFLKDGEAKLAAGQEAVGWVALDAFQVTLGALQAALPVRVSLFVC